MKKMRRKRSKKKKIRIPWTNENKAHLLSLIIVVTRQLIVRVRNTPGKARKELRKEAKKNSTLTINKYIKFFFTTDNIVWLLPNES